MSATTAAISGTATIDRAHLKAMTFGDTALEREVLALFDRQAAAMLERLRGPAAGRLGDLAHAIKGAARGIGAWQVAEAAGELEQAVSDDAMRDLTAALDDARRAIAGILAAK